MRKFVAIIAIAVSSLGLAACSSSGSAGSGGGGLKVVAAENFWGNIVQQIGGSHVSVTSLISNPNADPHQFESDTTDELDVSEAGLVIVNGAGYDSFMSNLLSAASSSHRQVLTMQTVLGITGNDPNPHLWYDVPELPTAINAIAHSMSVADPSDAAAYKAGAARMVAALHPLDATVVQIKQKYAGAPVAYTERVPGYLLAAAGLTVMTPPGFAKAIENGTDPSFGDTAAMRALITDHRIKVLLYNSQAVSPVTAQLKALAASSNVPVVPVSETMPITDNFQTWQNDQAKALLVALGSSR